MIYTLEDSILEIENTGIIVKQNLDSIELEYKSDFLTTEFLYYTLYKESIICSYDIFEIQKTLLSFKEEVCVDSEVLRFFIEKGYTPFDRTYLKGIYKLPNLVKLIFEKKTKSVRYELSRIAIDTNNKAEDIIIEAIKDSVERDKYNYILFSGGYDSTLVANITRQILPKDQIGLITGNLASSNFIPNKEDVYYSKLLSSKLDLSIQIVDKDIKSVTNDDLDNIIYKRPTTAHFSIVYQAIKDHINLTNINDYHVISGQQADSVLNFGSTSFFKFRGRDRFFEGKGDLVTRLLYLSSPLYTKVLFSLINKLDVDGYIMSPIIGYKKSPLIRNKDIYDDLLPIYKEFISKFNKEDAIFIKSSFLLIYVFTFLSGSDASGIISTFKADNSLPFSNKKLLWYFINKDNHLLDIIIPKRPIMNLLKKQSELWNTLKNRPNTPAISYLENFYKIGEYLGLKEYQREFEEKYDFTLPYSYNSIHLLKCLEKGK